MCEKVDIFNMQCHGHCPEHDCERSITVNYMRERYTDGRATTTRIIGSDCDDSMTCQYYSQHERHCAIEVNAPRQE